VLCELLRHPRIVVLRDAFLVAPLDFYLVYDFAGSDLAAVMKATSPGSLLVRSAMLQMLLGLEHIHSLGIIHTDMKPQNVLVETLPGNRWNICIGDLGSAIEVCSCC
jgi:serine/threonine protein kinase